MLNQQLLQLSFSRNFSGARCGGIFSKPKRFTHRFLIRQEPRFKFAIRNTKSAWKPTCPVAQMVAKIIRERMIDGTHARVFVFVHEEESRGASSIGKSRRQPLGSSDQFWPSVHDTDPK
jgi:hypothetical protein